MRTSLTVGFTLLAVLSAATISAAQDRATKVRNDRARLEEDEYWIYNDLDKGIAEARRTGKPLLVLFRCIPCEACSEFDEQVVRRHPAAQKLMDQFIGVRIVHANGMDLSLFQFDFDQSLAAVLMNADKTIYGRFGTRSASKDESQDMTMEGFAAALERALAMHRAYPANRDSLRGKQAPPSPVAVPEDYPSLKGKYGPKLDYEGKVVQSCIHCHQVRDAERTAYRDRREPIPDRVLFPYPLPQTIGLTLDARQCATVKAVAPGSPADRAGFRAGDAIIALGDQTLLSIADMQWVLHNAGDSAKLLAAVHRPEGEKTIRKLLTLELPAGWRQTSDISWRPTTWNLRRMATGGLILEPLADAERAKRHVPADGMALRVKHVGQYGAHAVAKQAGFQKEDIVIAFDGRTDLPTETALIAHAVQHKNAADRVPVTVLRDGRRVELTLPLQ